MTLPLPDPQLWQLDEPIPPDMESVTDAARRIGVTPQTLVRLVKQGRLSVAGYLATHPHTTLLYRRELAAYELDLIETNKHPRVKQFGFADNPRRRGKQWR